jgi:hypothetical protein
MSTSVEDALDALDKCEEDVTKKWILFKLDIYKQLLNPNKDEIEQCIWELEEELLKDI